MVLILYTYKIGKSQFGRFVNVEDIEFFFCDTSII